MLFWILLKKFNLLQWRSMLSISPGFHDFVCCYFLKK